MIESARLSARPWNPSPETDLTRRNLASRVCRSVHGAHVAPASAGDPRRRHPTGVRRPPLRSLQFVALAIGARLGALVWDKHVTDAVLGARTGFLNEIALRVSFLGSTRVVATVAVALALVTWRRCPRLAVAIALLALARPLVEFGLKELIDRPRPAGDRLVRGKGPAFPSGHPLAFALTWGLVPMVVALYTRRRAVWLAVAGVMWTLAVFVAASRVWLGVHWLSDVIAGLLLAVSGCPPPKRSLPIAVAAARVGRRRRHPRRSVTSATVVGSGPERPDRRPRPRPARARCHRPGGQRHDRRWHEIGELSVPGLIHDVCSAVHPFGAMSPVFRTLGLERHGLELGVGRHRPRPSARRRWRRGPHQADRPDRSRARGRRTIVARLFAPVGRGDRRPQRGPAAAGPAPARDIRWRCCGSANAPLQPATWSPGGGERDETRATVRRRRRALLPTPVAPDDGRRSG